MAAVGTWKRTMPASLITLPAMVLFLFACSPTMEAESDPGVLSQATLDSLKLEHERLGDEALPEPTPSADANPNRVPDRLARGVSEPVLERVTGQATFYADYFEGERTASGIPFRQNQMVAAHRAYPFGTIVRVTNLSNDRSVNVKVVDRGPFGSSAAAQRTIIDLSRRAAEQLGYIDAGRTPVRVEVLEWGSGVAS